MHFVGIGAGSAGDVLPLLAVARCLSQRGHEVQFMAAPAFQPAIESAGVAFVPGGTQAEFDRAVEDPAIWQSRRAMRALFGHIGPQWPRHVDSLARCTRGPETVVFGGGLALHMRMVQERTGIRTMTIHLAPASILSAHDPAVLPNTGWLRHLPPAVVGPIQSFVETRVLDPLILPDLNHARALIGLPRLESHVFSRWMNSPDRVICAFAPWFAAAQPDWPPQTVTTGFPFFDSPPGSRLAAPVSDFLDAGPPPLLFTPGSAMAHGREFFRRAIETSRRLAQRALLVTRYRDQLPDALPADMMHCAHAPFDLLMPRVRLLVHHGGIGTAAQALRAGVVQLITPFAFDQHDNAARLQRLGVADSVPPGASARRWAGRAARLLTDEAVHQRCRTIAGRIAEEVAGADRIADLAEVLARRS